MIFYCSKCKINWACLKRVDADSHDETYEVCPVCNSDHSLEDGNDIEAFIWCPISGAITNTVTGEPYAPPYKKPVIRVRVGGPQKKKLTPEERQDVETKAIDAYITTGSREAYFNTFNQAQ